MGFAKFFPNLWGRESQDKGLAASEPGPSASKRARFMEPHTSSSSGADPEMEIRALVLVASGLYPLSWAEVLSGLAAVLEKVNDGGIVCGKGRMC